MLARTFVVIRMPIIVYTERVYLTIVYFKGISQQDINQSEKLIIREFHKSVNVGEISGNFSNYQDLFQI